MDKNGTCQGCASINDFHDGERGEEIVGFATIKWDGW
jgi:hypothetical protein